MTPDFDKDPNGLLPAIVQDANTGETSGHFMMVKQIFLDCDLDTILVKAEPCGPACHTGSESCFFNKVDL